jgi:hypothetical protein
MINYFYHLDYSTDPPTKKADNHVIESIDDAPLSVESPIPHDYGWGMTKNKKKKLQREVSYLSGTVRKTRAYDLIQHANVYAIAEQYNINGLKLLARQKFDLASAAHWDTPEFLEAIHAVYTTTIETDRGLRNIVLRTLDDNNRLLDMGETRAVLQEIHALAYELLIYKHTGDFESFGGLEP